MIFDNIKNANTYYGLSKKIKIAFDFLLNNDLNNFEIGIHKIENDEIFMNIQEYDTKPISEGKWEAHRKYIDIQYMISGEEKFGFCDVTKLSSIISYNEEKDVEFFEGDKGEYISAEEGEFLIFYPQDAHKPCLISKDSQRVKKAIIKILID